MSDIYSVEVTDEAGTASMAQKLAPFLEKGDVLFLEGTLGAGKTAFARSLIRSLCGQDIDVPSPTFNLLLTYPAPAAEIYHYDFYRLEDPEEVWELDLEDALDDGISLMEWVSRLEDLAPEGALLVTIDIPDETGEARQITLSGDATWASRLAPLKALIHG